MQVEEIALLSTALIRWDGSRIVYPNAKMSTDMLINITRSGNKGDTYRVRQMQAVHDSLAVKILQRLRMHALMLHPGQWLVLVI